MTPLHRRALEAAAGGKYPNEWIFSKILKLGVTTGTPSAATRTPKLNIRKRYGKESLPTRLGI
jgi:hypothetical protein